MDITKYDNAVDTVTKSEELALLCHVNPDLREYIKQSPKLAGAFFLAMQDSLPKRVWSCPVMGGALLRTMCQEPLGAGLHLTHAAQRWATALGGDKR